jgi:hypothetical protein
LVTIFLCAGMYPRTLGEFTFRWEFRVFIWEIYLRWSSWLHSFESGSLFFFFLRNFWEGTRSWARRAWRSGALSSEHFTELPAALCWGRASGGSPPLCPRRIFHFLSGKQVGGTGYGDLVLWM